MFAGLKKEHLIIAALMLALIFGAGVRYGCYLAAQKLPPVAVLPAGGEGAEAVPDTETGQTGPQGEGQVTVYLTGAVIHPGVFTLKAGSRVADALDLAQADPDADLEKLNLAKRLSDGEKILVPRVRMGEAGTGSEGTSLPAAGEGEPAEASGLVDVNTAGAAELETLPGIGPSKAAAVIRYREEKGPFAALEDLDKVPGIGPATLDNLRDKVTF